MERTNDKLGSNLGPTVKTWWISFAGKVHNGCVIADGSSLEAALAHVTALGLNPGGEVMGFELPPDASDLRWGKDRLISPAELRGDGYRKLGELSPAEAEFLGSHPGVLAVCNDCNKKSK